MKQQYLELIRLMDKVNEMVQRLVVLAQEKKRLVIQGQVKQLDSLIREEGIVISELEKWEGARFRAQKQLEPDLADCKARDLQQKVARQCPHLKAVFQDSLSRLETSLGALSSLNQHNNELLQQSLDHIALLEAAIVGDQPGTYSQKGLQAEESRTRINLLDRKV